jgi:3-hydroxybutyryl-CoA dehydrogenase
MSCGQTDPAVIQLLVDLLPGYGLTPYVVQRESMGFIFNRVWAAIKRETLAVVAEGVASPEVVDAIICQATGMKPGPCRLMDAVGLDVVLSIEDNYAQHRPGLPEGRAFC